MKTVTYSYKNKIEYEVFETICVSVQISDDESAIEALNKLREEVDQLRRPNVERLNRKIKNKENKLQDLDRKIERVSSKWNMMQEFLAGQGIKNPNMMPSFDNLLPPVVQAEIVEEDGGDDDEEDDYDEEDD